MFDSTITTAISTGNLGNFTIGSLQVTGPGGTVTIGTSTNTLTLNTAGIDMSAATADLTIGTTANTGFLRIASANFSGTFNVAASRTLTINTQLSNQGNTKTLTFSGSGNIVLNGSSGAGGAASFNVNGANVTMNGAGGWSSANTLTSGTLNVGNDSAVNGNLGLNGGTVAASGAAHSIASTVTLGAAAAIGGTNALTFGGVFTQGGNFTLTNNNTTNATVFSGGINISNSATNRTLTIAGAGSELVSGVVANGSTSTAGILNYTGTGTLTLSNATNTFTGGVTIGNGTVQLGSTGALNPTAGSENSIAFGASTTGALALAGNSVTVSNLTGSVTGPVVKNANGSSVSNATLTVGNASNLSGTYAGVLQDGTGGGTLALAKTGTGTLILSNSNTYTGGTTVTTGSLALGNATDTLANTGAVNVNGGTLSLGTNSDTVGAVTLTSGTISGSTGVLSGSSYDVQSGTVSGILGGSGSTLGKSTAGAVTLSAVNTYTGATSVTGGTLTVSGTGSINGSSGITINGSGAKFVKTSTVASTPAITVTQGTLDGTGTVGAVTVGNSTGGIVSNGNGATTTLTVGSLAFGGAGTLSLNKANDTNTTVALAVTGAFSTTVANGQVTLSLVTAPTWSNGSTYNIISYGSFTGANSDFTLGSIANLGPRQAATIGNTGSGSGFITLAITGDTPYWTGGQSTSWTANTVGGAQNWKLVTAGTGTEFLSNDQVLFNDSAAGSGTVTVDLSDTDVNPTVMTFTNATRNYVVSGSKAITSGSLTKSGAAALTLSTANTYSGGTSLSAGTLNINNASAIGTGALTISGGTLDNTSGSAITLSTNNAQNWNGNFAFTGSNALNLGTGAVTLGANRIVTVNGSTLTVGGIIGDGGNAYALTKAGAGVLVLNGANTYTGGTTLTAGTLQVNNASSLGATAGNLTFDGGTLQLGATIATTSRNYGINSGKTATIDTNSFNLTHTGVISSVGVTNTSTTDGLIKNGTGTLTLSGANTYTGQTVINGGTLTLGNSLALQTSTLNYNNQGGSLGFGTITAATLGGLSGAQNLALTNTTPAAVALTVGGNNVGTTYSGVLSGSGSVTKTGTGTLTLSGANTYTGNTSVGGGGTLAITNALGTSGTPSGAITDTASTLNISGATIYASSLTHNNTGATTVTLSGGAAVTLSGALSVNSGNNTQNGVMTLGTGTLSANSVSIGRTGLTNGGTLQTAGSTTDGLYVNGATVTIANALGIGNNASSNSSANMRIDAGSVTVGGTTTITVNNTRYSVLDVAGGTFTSNDTSGAGILIGGNFAGTNAELLVRGSSVVSANKITFGNATQTSGTDVLHLLGGTTYLGSGGIVLGTASPTYGTAINFGGTTYATAPTLGASANWSSSMAMTLTNSSSSVKPTFKAADASNVAHDISLSGVLSGTGGFTKTGGGTLTLTGTNTYSGATAISSGTLQLGDGTTDGTIASTSGVTDNGTLAYNWAGNHSVAYLISGTGALTKAGAGTLTLTAANSYSGGTTVSAGTATLSGSGAFGSGTVTSSGGTIDLGGKTITNTLGALTGGGAVNNGTIQNYDSNFDVQSGSVGAVLDGNNGLNKTTGGTVVLSGVNTYLSDTTVSAGKLTVSSGGSINGTNSVLIGAGEFNYNSSTALTATVSFTGTGGILSGSGSIGSALTLTSGNTLSPGNSPGLLTTGAQTWSNGGNYNWQIFDATGIAGTGYDSIAITSGGLNLTGLTTGGFNINLWSLSGTSTDGNATNFDNSINHTWTLVSNTGDLTSVAGSVFNINVSALNGTAGFTNDLGGGSFSVVGAGNELDLVFTAAAIPEPSTCALLAGLAGLTVVISRRRRQA